MAAIISGSVLCAADAATSVPTQGTAVVLHRAWCVPHLCHPLEACCGH